MTTKTQAHIRASLFASLAPAAILRRIASGFSQQQQTHREMCQLLSLDEHLLRDIGLDPGDIAWVAAQRNQLEATLELQRSTRHRI